MVGDQFHRIMRLLCLEPGLLQEYRCTGNHADVVKQVCAGDAPEHLLRLVDLYFNDTANEPYELLTGGRCRSEVPFSVVREDASTNPPHEFLVKGFIDVVQFNDDGNPDLVLDYKTGERLTGEISHIGQLELYRDALALTYQVAPATISMVNYYVTSQEWVARS
jgi:ATP-dependent exoDNAse (exonuclease V) beta subunit